MKRLTSLALVSLVSAAALLACVGSAPAQTKFPSKPIELVVPWSPGGGSDRVARALAGTWGVYADVPLRIFNRAAGGGREGHLYGAKAAPDGHTLTITAINLLTMPAYGDVGFDLESFSPMFNVVRNSYWVIVRKDAPYNNMKEFIAHLKANPGKLSYGSSGTGSDQHIGTEVFLNKLGGLELTQKHVPLEGGSEQIAMLLGGHNDFGLGTYGTWTPTVKSGKVKVLAVTDVERNPDTPDVPTLREQGIDWEFISFRCMLAPAKTPPALIAKLHADVVRVLAMPDIRARFAAQAAEPIGSTPAAFRDYIRAEIDRWGRVSASAKVVLD